MATDNVFADIVADRAVRADLVGSVNSTKDDLNRTVSR
jgi:hypothetical protein